MQTIGKRPKLSELLLQHMIVFMICVAFPGGVTLMAPATWLTLACSEEGVRCTSRTCVFFVVPFKVQRVDRVIAIGQRERAGRTERQRKFGRTTNNTVEVDGEGFLQIHGAGDQSIEVSVSPASLESVAAKSKNFLLSPQKSSTTMFMIANWKFGGVMGGFLTLLTLLYVVGYILEISRWMLTSAKSAVTRLSGP